MNLTAYAAHAKVNKSTVSRWIKSGRISLEADGSIDPEKADRARAATESPMPHHQARKAQIDAEKAAQAAQDATAAQQPATAGIASAEAVMIDKAAEAALYMRRKREKMDLEIDKETRALVDRAEVDYVLTDFGHTLRSLIEGLPDRLAGALAACRGDTNAIHKELDDAARQLLSEMAGHMARRAEERL